MDEETSEISELAAKGEPVPKEKLEAIVRLGTNLRDSARTAYKREQLPAYVRMVQKVIDSQSTNGWSMVIEVEVLKAYVLKVQDIEMRWRAEQ